MSLRNFDPISGDEEPLVFGKTGFGSVLDPELEELPLEEKTASQKELELIHPDKWRWFVLASFCFAAWVNSILWITFSPISVKVEDYYHVTAFWVNCMKHLNFYFFFIITLFIFLIFCIF